MRVMYGRAVGFGALVVGGGSVVAFTCACSLSTCFCNAATCGSIVVVELFCELDEQAEKVTTLINKVRS